MLDPAGIPAFSHALLKMWSKPADYKLLDEVSCHLLRLKHLTTRQAHKKFVHLLGQL